MKQDIVVEVMLVTVEHTMVVVLTLGVVIVVRVNYIVWKKIMDKYTWKHFTKGRVKKKIKKNGWIYPSGLAGWGQAGSKIQPK